MLRSLAAAFSMYSIIPMPQVQWDRKTMKYAICFFPFVGAVTGAVQYAFFMLMKYMETGILLKSSVMVIIPVIISGGIHLDGFMDTTDALASHAERSRKLEIMKDPHTGAFAVIFLTVYMLLYAGLASEITEKEILSFSMGYFLVRALSGFFLMVIPKAKKEGLAVSWCAMTDNKAAYILMAEFIICAILMIFAGNIPGICAVAFVLAVAVMQFFMCKVVFGGITGDIAGFILQVSELAVLAGCVIGGYL